MQAGVTDDGNVAGTGPYRAVQVETDQGLTLVKNDNYWNGTPKLDRIEVKNDPRRRYDDDGVTVRRARRGVRPAIFQSDPVPR